MRRMDNDGQFLAVISLEFFFVFFFVLLLFFLSPFALCACVVFCLPCVCFIIMYIYVAAGMAK